MRNAESEQMILWIFFAAMRDGIHSLITDWIRSPVVRCSGHNATETDKDKW